MYKSLIKSLTTMLIPNYIVPIARILFGLLFVFSGITKVTNIASFQDAIVNFAIIPDHYVTFLSYFICIAEIIIGFCITTNLLLIAMLRSITYILVLFTSVIVIQLVQGDEISCGCFGALSTDKIDMLTVVRNVILIIWSSILFTYYLKVKADLTSKLNFKERFQTFLITSCFIFFLVSNSALAIRNIELKNRVNRLINNEILSEGEIVKPFEVIGLDGTKLKIDFKDSNKLILFIMKYGCEVCKNNIDTWNKIYERFNSKESRILGISVNDMMYTKKMIDSYKINFKVTFNSTSDFKENFKVILTPITILIGNDGMVENIWKGTISEELIPFLDKKLNNN